MEYILKGLVIAAFMFFSFRANQKEARKKAEAPHGIPEKPGNGTPGGAPMKFHKKYRNTILLSCFLLVHLFVTLAGINRTTNCDTPAKATILSIRTTKKSTGSRPGRHVYTVYHAKISYNAPGNQSFKRTVSSSDGNHWKVGGQIDILYNSKSPGTFTTPQQFDIMMEMKTVPAVIIRTILVTLIIYSLLLCVIFNSDKARWKKQNTGQ